MKYLILLSLMACSSYGPQKRDPSHVPLHGGIVLKGKNYYVELVGKHKSIKIYPMTVTKENALSPLSASDVELFAEYSPSRSKANWTLPLDSHSDHFTGKVDPRGEPAYQVYVDMKVGSEKERFYYSFQRHELD